MMTKKAVSKPYGGRFKRAVAFSDAHRLRYVVVGTEGGVMQDARPVPPYLEQFASVELERVLQHVADFHAALMTQLGPGRPRLAHMVTDRVQALIGALELERADQ